MAQLKAISTHKQGLCLSQTFFCKMNNCYVTYLIGPNINDCLFINCNTVDIVRLLGCAYGRCTTRTASMQCIVNKI